MQLQRILVAIKPWERGLPLTSSHARQLARNVGGQIQLVGTVFDAGVAAGRDRGESAARVTQGRAVAAARVELERLAGSMREWGAQITTKVLWGAPAYEGILSAAAEWRADLLVVGAHEPHTMYTRLTDTDWQLMRRVSCPLLLVKNPVFSGYRTVLAAIDPPHADDAPEGFDRAVLDASRCFARTFGSTLWAVQAALVEEYGAAGTDLDPVDGAAADAVLESVTKRSVELVVVGAPRRPGLLAAAVGGTTETVAAAVSCDVLIVPAAPAESEARARR